MSGLRKNHLAIALIGVALGLLLIFSFRAGYIFGTDLAIDQSAN
jgi:hypothetical protein